MTSSIKRSLLLLSAILLTCSSAALAQAPKREFRGAWIQCVNNQFNGIGTKKMQETLTYQLDELQKDGINCIIFQVRPEGDALYASSLEPWSRYLTGRQGLAPDPYWDPLQWMIEQCHKRNMELHAWINPFRAKTKGTPALTSTYYREHPDRFFDYDGLWLFDPGIPENRAYICHVAADITRHYDIDGLHIDDYFYPYPVSGVQIPDDASYAKYNGGLERKEWRRENVNKFIEALGDSLHSVKPWVKFGVSPFGIYRNQSSDYPDGSATHGLQNYDDLYADVLLWVKKGWVDYNVPQLYWEIGNKAADYETLVKWWNDNASGRPLYIGQDVERTVKHTDLTDPSRHQMIRKYQLQRAMMNVQGSCQWYAKAVVDNPGNYGTMLRLGYHRYPSLQPSMPWLDAVPPAKVRSMKAVWTQYGYILFWTAPKAKKEMDKAVLYVVYCFKKGERIDISDASHIKAITHDTNYTLPYIDGKTEYTYVVTALDRVQNESKIVKRRVKL